MLLEGVTPLPRRVFPARSQADGAGSVLSAAFLRLAPPAGQSGATGRDTIIFGPLKFGGFTSKGEGENNRRQPSSGDLGPIGAWINGEGLDVAHACGQRKRRVHPASM